METYYLFLFTKSFFIDRGVIVNHLPLSALSCVAMLKLKAINKPYCAIETRFVKTACLPNQPFDSGTECVISGWGVTETREYHLKSKLLLLHLQTAGQPL